MVSTLSNVPTNNPIISLKNDENLELCFNKANFVRQEFSVERFVNLSRKRATLDVIHNDLRTYLRFLQNSMIELINDDYADFLNLSSSLAALKENIEQVLNGIENSWKFFLSNTAELKTTFETVQQKCIELNANRLAQISIRNKIFLLFAIQHLSQALNQRPSTLSFWLSKLILLVIEVETWFNRFSTEDIPQQAIEDRQSCYSRIKKILIEELIADMNSNFNNITNILKLLTLIGKDNLAIEKITENVIISHITIDESIEKEKLLRNFFDELIKLRKKWIDLLEKQTQLNLKTELFIDKVLLQYSNSFLSKNFGSVFVPSDTRLFYKCYQMTVKFISEWPLKFNETKTLLQMLINKFNLTVYFKILTQKIQNDIKLHIENVENIKIISKKNKNFNCKCELSIIILNSLNEIFDSDNYQFLPTLSDKFWNFTLKTLISYCTWAKNINKHYLELKNNNWEDLVVLVWDISTFNNHFTKICKEKIWEKFAAVGIENFDSFNECLNIFSTEILQIKKEILETIAKLLCAITTKELKVNEISKEYRWTKRPSPTTFSPYLQTIVQHNKSFLAKCNETGWSVAESHEILKKILENLITVFTNSAEEVLKSVEQTGSSLQRLRKLQQHQREIPDSSDLDETKIRAQLSYDIDFMCQQADEWNIDNTRLKNIQKSQKNI